jgi:hypothetical protein
MQAPALHTSEVLPACPDIILSGAIYRDVGVDVSMRESIDSNTCDDDEDSNSLENSKSVRNTIPYSLSTTIEDGWMSL